MAPVRRTTCVIWLSLATGCYSPDLPEGLPCSETDRCPDGQSCDPALRVCASFAPCATPEISDRFDDGPICTPWGRSYGNATGVEEDGAFAITPASIGQNDGGCKANFDMPFGAGGIFVEVARPLTREGGYTGFLAEFAPAESMQVELRDGVLRLGTFIDESAFAEVPFDPPAMRWWRMRPDRRDGTATLAAEYSGDGSRWSPLGTRPGEPPATIRITIYAGTLIVDPDPGTAEFRNLGVCPPGTALEGG